MSLTLLVLSTSTDTTTATATTSTDASSTTTSKTNNGNAYGHDKQSDKADKKAKKDHKEHPGQGLEHRSDRANEVAQNTVKNPHLIDSDTGGGDTGGGDTGDTGGDTPLADIAYDFTGGAEFLYYYHPDHLGSTGFVTDKKGELYEHIEYFPFGETWIQEATSNWKVPYMYTGKELDQDTQLYYYGARYYDPRTSVWQSADPILGKYLPSGDKEKDKNLSGMGGVYNSGNLSLYGYVNNHPLISIDPDGKEELRLSIEGNAPSIGMLIQAAVSSIAPDSGIIIPEGLNLGISLSFPGLSGTGEYGIAASLDAVVGPDFGVEGRVLKDKKFNMKKFIKSLWKISATAEADFNWTKKTAHEATSGLGDEEAGGFLLILGGQISKNKDGDVSGVGLKFGGGLNAGVNMNLPLLGVGYNKKEGIYTTGESGSKPPAD